MPLPMTTGHTNSVISSTNWLSSSQRIRAPLPCTCSSPPGLALRSAMAVARVVGEDGGVRPLRIGECGRCHVLGLRVQGRGDGVDARIFHRTPRAADVLVGPPPEQNASAGRYTACGAIGQIGSQHLYTYSLSPGAVLRCQFCQAILLVLVNAGARYRLAIQGLKWLEIRAA
jgi:hypothetical protein